MRELLLLRERALARHRALPLAHLLRGRAVRLGLGLHPGHLLRERLVLGARGVELGLRRKNGAGTKPYELVRTLERGSTAAQATINSKGGIDRD